MTSILQSLSKTVHLSLGIAIILLLGLHFFGDGFAFDRYFFSWLFRYLHVLTGIMWIGLLWYFNFVQIPSMPNIPDEQKPAIGKVIAPKAWCWFRWAALGTIVTGLIVSYLQGYVHQAMILGIGSGDPKLLLLELAWLGIIMAYNVWFVALSEKSSWDCRLFPEEKAKSAKTAMLFSRTNTLLSFPMLLSMVAAQKSLLN